MIESFWNICLSHDLKTRDQLLREAVRVIKLKQYIDQTPSDRSALEGSAEKLFEVMKDKIGAMELGHFPGDRELFYKLYHAGKELDLLDYGLHTIRQDRVIGSLQVHPSVFNQFMDNTLDREGQHWLIAEAEKFIEGLALSIPKLAAVSLTLLTENYVLGRLLTTYFTGNNQIQVIQGSIYQPLPLTESYDAVLSVPNFGMKLDDSEVNFREAEGAAIQHLSALLTRGGILAAVLPARMLFQSGAVGAWREQMTGQFPVKCIYALPEGLFRPFTSVKTYFVVFNNASSAEGVRIGRYRLKSLRLEEEEAIDLQAASFAVLADWRIELLLEQDSQTLAAFQQAATSKVKLKSVADIFRGKSILKQDLRPGPIYILNISNLEEGEVSLNQLETIQEEERKVKRYELCSGDLVMTCRGTQTKLAVFPEHSEMVIASANIIVIRFREQIHSSYAKIFMESPVGLALIQSFQRGTTVMNLNPADVGEIEIPLLPMGKQLEIAKHYQKEKQLYTDTIKAALTRWEQQREQLYTTLY